MLDQTLARLAHELAVDPGSSKTRVLVRGRSALLEPSVVAIEQLGTTTRIVAVGEDAHRMIGRTPEHITAAHPIVRGRVDDFQLAEALLVHCVRKALGSRPRLRTRMVICVSQGTTEVERRALQESARAAGVREVHLVSQAIAAALGVGLPIHEASANVVIDIGAGTTQASLLSLGSVVDSLILPIGGLNLDEAIVTWVERNRGAQVSIRSAEQIKLAIGGATPDAPDRTIQVKGRDLSSGIPRDLHLRTADIVDACRPVFTELVAAMGRLFANASPELSADTLDRGLVLCGGSALLPGLAQFIGESTGLPVLVAEEPMLASVRGAAMVLDDPALLERVIL